MMRMVLKMPIEPPRVSFSLAVVMIAIEAGMVSATPMACTIRKISRSVKVPAAAKASVAAPITTSPTWIDSLRCPIASTRLPITGWMMAVTIPNTPISSPTRTVAGNGRSGAASLSTYSGSAMNRMLLPTASPSRATDSATTTRLAPIFFAKFTKQPFKAQYAGAAMVASPART